MEGNDAYLGQSRECMLGDPACEEHYDFAGPGLDNTGLPNSQLDLRWHDSWYDQENNMHDGRTVMDHNSETAHTLVKRGKGSKPGGLAVCN